MGADFPLPHAGALGQGPASKKLASGMTGDRESTTPPSRAAPTSDPASAWRNDTPSLPQAERASVIASASIPKRPHRWLARVASEQVVHDVDNVAIVVRSDKER